MLTFRQEAITAELEGVNKFTDSLSFQGNVYEVKSIIQLFTSNWSNFIQSFSYRLFHILD